METNDILDIYSAGRNAAGMTLRALARLLAAHPGVTAGIALGGRAGIGTLVHAAAIGPAAPWSFQLFEKDPA